MTGNPTKATAQGSTSGAATVLDTYRLGLQPIYVIGSFDTGVTILNQQIRALNLAWALVDTATVPTEHEDGPIDIAVVGAGFAGMTLAAGLLAKGARANITIFERRDTAMPLQQGSDTRWVHPHIYDWPRAGSESVSAGLPVLNWTANRASDVVVQVLNEWRHLLGEVPPPTTSDDRLAHRFFCNTGNLQIVEATTPGGSVAVEWSGKSRNFADPSVPALDAADEDGGRLDKFHIVVLAAGFGLEEGALSYWRNEQFAQPHLGQGTMNYIVSGAGDGAMVDLFRIRIAQFRQDRILPELFHNRRNLVAALRHVQDRCERDPSRRVFDELDTVWRSPDTSDQFKQAIGELAKRLRRDTQVILHVRTSRFTDLLDHRRVSFQNQLLAYMLFTAGGFTQSTQPLNDLAEQYGVPSDRVVLRHGINAGATLRSMLSSGLCDELRDVVADPSKLRQRDESRWTGGYFGFPGRDEAKFRNSDAVKARWRKEYLPGLTQAVSASFCAGVAGFLRLRHPGGERLRVTLHRTLRLGNETLLQQCCAYDGAGVGNTSANVGRTFHATDATIGAAFHEKAVVRSSLGAKPPEIQRAMDQLSLNRASQGMSTSVHSVAAVPLLDENEGLISVVGVLYLDSDAANFFNDDERMGVVIDMTTGFLRAVREMPLTRDGRVVNNEFWTGRAGTPLLPPPPPADVHAIDALEVASLTVPPVSGLGQLNLDQSDFAKAGVP